MQLFSDRGPNPFSLLKSSARLDSEAQGPEYVAFVVLVVGSSVGGEVAAGLIVLPNTARRRGSTIARAGGGADSLN